MADQTGQSVQAFCNYEGTSYRADFWEGHGREYEDLAERRALRRLLPANGRRIVEVGAGFGRLADLYSGYEQIILLDYATSGLREARAMLGESSRFVFVAANIYHLPLAPATCDTVVSVRVLHHLADVPAALRSIAATLRPGGAYVLEYANKRNLKAIARYLSRRQSWSPFTAEPYEFIDLNFDFHPRWMATQLAAAGFAVDRELAVSHFRHPLFKRLVPPATLAAIDGAIQRPSAAWKLSPSIMLRGTTTGQGQPDMASLFVCPACRSARLSQTPSAMTCQACGSEWPVCDGIYDFRMPR